MQNHLRLDDLLARDVAPRWFEGVAVVQLICRQLRAQDARVSGFPRAADILIGSGGSIAIAGASAGNPVQAAAHVLALMLSDDVPVRLRLAVSQATATDSGYATLADFSEALGYFERPNPESIVEAFRQRALLAPPREMGTPKAIEATPATDHRAAPVPVAPPRGASRMAVIAATVAAVACASVWLIGRVTHVAEPGIVTVETPQPEVPAQASRAKGKTNDEAAPPSKSAIGTQATTAAEAPRTRREAHEAHDKAPELQVTAESVSYSYPELSLSAPPVSAPETSQAGPATSVSTGNEGPDIEVAPDRIYSRADSQVTLPLSVYPKLPPETAASGVTGRTILELTIARDGLVERVKMLTAPRNIHEFMLLSAAKAWRFEPARIDGRAVRFRHTMVLTAMP
jgi:outer membrane biosynthesis protein TonB